MVDGSIDRTTILLEENFDNSLGDFKFKINTFQSTYTDERYSNGKWFEVGGIDGTGCVDVWLGGHDFEDVEGMSGGWEYVFSLELESMIEISFAYNLGQSAWYESREFSTVIVKLDSGKEVEVDRISGNGNFGNLRSTGWKTEIVGFGPVSAGSHAIVVGAFNNQKSTFSESTQLLIDNVVLKATESTPSAPVILSSTVTSPSTMPRFSLLTVVPTTEVVSYTNTFDHEGSLTSKNVFLLAAIFVFCSATLFLIVTIVRDIFQSLHADRVEAEHLFGEVDNELKNIRFEKYNYV